MAVEWADRWLGPLAPLLSVAVVVAFGLEVPAQEPDAGETGNTAEESAGQPSVGEQAKGEEDETAGAEATGKALQPGVRLGLVLRSKASGAKVYTAIPGAKKTVLAAAHESKYGLRTFSDVEWRDKAYDLREFYAEAERTADAVVDAMQPEMVRDSREVIEYALVKSEDAFLSTAITSKRFLPRFEREFGEELRVVVVDRHIFYVFPAVGGKLEDYGSAIAEIFRTTRFPVSLEVFEVNSEGYRVVGTLDAE